MTVETKFSSAHNEHALHKKRLTNAVNFSAVAPSFNMDDAVDLAQNRPLWRLMSTFGATHS